MAFTPVQKLSITSGAAMVLLAAVGIVAYLSISQLVDAQAAAAVTNRNIGRLDLVLERTLAADVAIRRYAETARPAALALIDSAQSDVEYAFDSLRRASEDNPEQHRNLDSLGSIVGARFKDIRQVALLRKKLGHDTAAAMLKIEHAGPGPSRLIAEMRNEEVRVLGERSRVMVDTAKTTRLFIISGSIFALVLALVALQPLRPSVEREFAARMSRSMSSTDFDAKE